jgi:uncharacterized membrane protein YedE/YeeE
MNRFIGMIGTTVGGGLIGAGIQRTHMLGNRISSGLSKLVGKGGLKFDRTTWVLLVAGVIVLCAGIYFSTRKK